MRWIVSVADAARTTDVLISAEPGATVGDLQRALAVSGLGGAGAQLWAGTQRLEAAAPLEHAGLKDGSVISVRRGVAPPDPGSTLHLRVVGGPDSGTVYPLSAGVNEIGRGAQCAIRLGDGEVSRRHARITVQGRTIVLEDGDSTNGTLLEGTAIAAPATLDPATMVEIGNDRIEVAPAWPPDAALHPADDGNLAYNRPPRYVVPDQPLELIRPAEPKSPERRALPLVAMLVPLAFGGVMFATGQSPFFLLFALMTPVLLVGNFFSERRQGGKTLRRQRAEYARQIATTEQKLAAARVEEMRRRREAAPDAATALLFASGPRRRLWERRRSDEDHLLLRIGLGRLPAAIHVKSSDPFAADDEPVELADVPLTVGLADTGVFGVAGPRDQRQALARWLVGQTSLLTSPRDVTLVLLTMEGSEAEGAWGWLRWLPHARPLEGVEAVAGVGNDPDTRKARIAELGSLVAARLRVLEEARGSRHITFRPDVVVVLDGARALRSLPGVVSILQEGPRVGVYAICLDETDRLLPEECRAVASFRPDGVKVDLQYSRGAAKVDVLADQVTTSWGEMVARCLSPLRDSNPDDGEGELPASLRLLDLVKVETPDDVMARWTIGGRTTAAVLGATVDGPFVLDLRRDGPHGLVAGTTGAGKSELLQTLIASLAVGNRPDALTFVLVDYKGGSAFKDCALLPHTVGMVTDLDGHLVERALASLTAELKRREAMLGRAQAKDIEDYWEALGKGAVPGGAAMPRLVIVIDEFASLVAELPDFVKGLVGIAQRGRSLGVHLVLATQRPSGVVSPEIRANTNIRVALRVTDPSESVDVIEAPDAARIPRSVPGRGYARTGHSSLTAFQSARVGGRRPGISAAGLPEVTTLLWNQLGRPWPDTGRVVVSDDETDLHALVGAIVEAAKRMGIDQPPSPWLPALPEVVTVGELERVAPANPGELAPIPIGLQDLPERQTQRSVSLDVEHGGHLLVAGSPRSGRSSVLRAIGYGVGSRYDPGDVHLFGLDCGNGALQPLAELPHCGAVVARSQVERGDRLLRRLSEEVSRRQDLLARQGFADVAEQRAGAPPAARLPYLVFLVDRWEGFMETFDAVDGGRLTDVFLRLLKEGPGAGLRVVVTGDRAALLGKLASVIEDKYVLRLADRSDFALASINPRHLPDAIPPGRAFSAGSGLETQFALIARDPAGPAQVAALRELAASLKAKGVHADPPSRRPIRVDVLPEEIGYADALALGGQEAPEGPLNALVGVGGDDLAACWIDLERSGPGFTIAGPPRSGRSTALMSVTRSLLEGGASVVVLAPRPSPLRHLGGEPGVLGVLTAADPPPAGLAKLLESPGPLAVVVDDAELLHPSDIQPVLIEFLRTARDSQRALVVAGSTQDLIDAFRGFTVDVRKSRSGLILTPQAPQNGELFGIRLPASAVFGGPAGRGVLVSGTKAQLVQVPGSPEWSSSQVR